MILGINAGNSYIMFGCMDDNNICFTSRIATDVLKTPDQYAIEMKNIMQLYKVDPEKIEGAIVSCVASQLYHVLALTAEKITGKVPLIIGPGIKTGINIKTENPAQVGSDLCATAVAAQAEYPGPTIIISLGTATTMTVVDKTGAYIGGAIMPGVQISLDALVASAAQLPEIFLDPPRCLISPNTVDAIRSGVIFGHAAMIDGMVENMRLQLDANATVLATGLLAPFIIPHCKTDILCDEHLLMKGLRIIYKKNS